MESSELICLGVGVPYSIVMIILAIGLRLSRLYLFVAAFLSALAAAVFTVAENVLWAQLFDFLEHFCYAATGILLAAGTWAMAAWSRSVEGGER